MLVNFFVKVVLLLLYLVFLGVLLRLLDLSAWYETGFLAAQLVDPLSLSVSRLKLLLEGRGLSHEGMLEREELVSLAESSGDIAEADLQLLEQGSGATLKQQRSVEFTGRGHFLEEVEDKKDSVWLVQVVPGATTPLLAPSVWKNVVQKVSVFGIRTGTFICARDIRFCRQKGWTNQAFVLLAMPDGHQYKDHVVSRQLYSASRASGVVDWVNRQLSSKLTEIPDEEELCSHWLKYKSEEEISQSVRTVIFTPYEPPSLLYSALSMQYSGRVKFGYYRERERVPTCGVDLKPDSKTHMSVLTANGMQVYGRRKGEFLNMDALNLYYRTLVPEINDVFIVTFVAINLFCFMDLFLTSGGLAKIFLSFFWQLAKWNLLFILLWLPLLWLVQLPIISGLSDFVWWVVQLLCQTWYAGQLRQDWLMYSHHWKEAGGAFTLYCLVFGWLVKKCRPRSQEDSLSSVEWLRLIFHQLHLFMVRPRSGIPRGGPQINLEEGAVDLFMQGGTTPDLWLHPVISGEYIHSLPQWRYGGSQRPSHPHRESTSYRPKDLCSHCRAGVQRLFACTGLVEDGGNQKMFEKSCREIHQILATTKTTMVADLGCVQVCKDGRNDCGKAEEVVVEQPMGIQSKNVADGGSFCEDCLEIIRQIGEKWEEGGPSVLVDGNDGKMLDMSDDRADPWPEEILRSSECAICLEVYMRGVSLCGLPCGHAFHLECVQVWLCGGKHCCPTCRWPAFKKKPSKLSKYKE